jgi:GTP-binding protein EngB required for normal cell division
MTTHFITAEIDLQETPTELQEQIQNQLQEHGQPLRWAVTKIDQEKQKATIEAVVTKES